MKKKSLLHDDWLWLTFAWFLLGAIGSTIIYLQDRNGRFSDVEFQSTEGKVQRFNTFVTCSAEDCYDVVNMRVSYSVNGDNYTTSRFSLGHIDGNLAQSIMSDFQAGNASVKVWYNPQHPETAVIDYDKPASRVQFLFFLLVSALPFIVKVLWRLLKRIKGPASAGAL